MFRIILIASLCALAAAGHYGTPVVYESAPVSGYQYEHTVQTQDYTNHASVNAPLGGLVKSYSSPLVGAYHTAPVVKTIAAAPIVKAYHQAPVVSSYASPYAQSYGVPTVYGSSVHAW